jgi:hypothetical protein
MAFSKIAAENLGGSTLPALAAGSLTGISTALTPMWYVRRNADQALTNNTFTKVEWDSEVIDTDSAFASNKFTVPSGKAGKYYSRTSLCRN